MELSKLRNADGIKKFLCCYSYKRIFDVLISLKDSDKIELKYLKSPKPAFELTIRRHAADGEENIEWTFISVDDSLYNDELFTLLLQNIKKHNHIH